MYVRAIISQGVRSDALLAPQVGLTRDASGQATALVVGAENKVEPRAVRVSRAIGDQCRVAHQPALEIGAPLRRVDRPSRELRMPQHLG